MESKSQKESVEVTEQVGDISKIKDVEFTLRSHQSNTAQHTTEMINGWLEGIFIDTNKPIQISITLTDTDTIIYENVNFVGKDYLTLRTQARDKNNERINFSSEKWPLNGTINIMIKGMIQTDTKIKIRYN